MRIRPCIDIHNGRVKQIVGGSLRDANGASSPEQPRSEKFESPADAGISNRSIDAIAPAAADGAPGTLLENFVSEKEADYYASLYRKENLPGGHIILLNSVKDAAQYEADRRQAYLALSAYPKGMQVGGGITPQTAGSFLSAGASHVVVTSYVFRDGMLDEEHLREMVRTVGEKQLVLDLSCRRQEDGSYVVVTDRWQKLTRLVITPQTLDFLADYCDEFLIHAADVEGKRAGVEETLVGILGDWQKKSGFPVTYAGGVHTLSDLSEIAELSGSRMDVTVGSALDLFGGTLSLAELKEKVENLSAEKNNI